MRGFMLTAAGVVIGWTALVLGEGFDGVVHFKNTMGGRGSEFDYFMKGEKSRMEIESEGHAGKAAVILDTKAKRVIMLMPAQKMAMEMPIQDPGEPSAFKAENLTRTGKTQTILGYATEQVVYKNEDGETEVWGAKGLGSFAGMHGRPGQSGTPAWVRDMQKEGFFPLLVIHKDKTGAERGRMSATKVEKKALSDDLFAIPADYKTFDRDSMMRGMGGPGGPGGPGGMPGDGGKGKGE